MSYGGDEHRGRVINLVNWVFTAACIVFFAMRVISRTVLTKQFGIDDIFMVASVAILVCTVSVLSVGVSYGYGKHVWDLTPNQSVMAGKYAVIASALIVNTFAWPKLAIVALLQRIFVFSRITSVIFWTLATGMVFVSLLLSILWWVQCSPRAHQWNPIAVPGTCWDPSVVQNLSYFAAAYSALLDLLWATYPLIVVHKLKMPLRTKFLICGTMSGGYAAAIICMYKITTLPGLGRQAKKDPTWAEVPLLIWTIVEAATLMIMACLPTIGPVVRYILERHQSAPGPPPGPSDLMRRRKVGPQSTISRILRPAFDKNKRSDTLASLEAGEDEMNLVQMHGQCRVPKVQDPDPVSKTEPDVRSQSRPQQSESKL